MDGVLPTVAVAEGTLEVDRLAGRELNLDLDDLLPATVAVAEGRLLETVDRLPAPFVVAIVGRGVYLRLDSLLVVAGSR